MHPEMTTGPLTRRHIESNVRSVDCFVSWRRENRQVEDPRLGGLNLAPPYQRGDVWSVWDQRRLIKSLMLGMPVPTVVVNNRREARFRHPDGGEDWRYAVVDGKQRITALLRWCDDELMLPANWFEPGHVERVVGFDGAAWVTRSSLTPAGDRILRNRLVVPVAEAQLPTLEEEVDVYLLLNRAGVRHTDADYSRAENARS